MNVINVLKLLFKSLTVELFILLQSNWAEWDERRTNYFMALRQSESFSFTDYFIVCFMAVQHMFHVWTKLPHEVLIVFIEDTIQGY